MLRSASCEQGHAYFGRILTRTLRLEYKNVKSVKKAKTHKPRKHWNHMKYLLDHDKLLELICSRGMGMNSTHV